MAAWSEKWSICIAWNGCRQILEQLIFMQIFQRNAFGGQGRKIANKLNKLGLVLASFDNRVKYEIFLAIGQKLEILLDSLPCSEQFLFFFIYIDFDFLLDNLTSSISERTFDHLAIF